MSVSEQNLQAADLSVDEDKELAVAFKEGKLGAYNVIYARHSQRVECICRRMLRDPHDAAEASQETFLRVYKALPRFNGRYQLGAWIARIATNVCLDQIRLTGRRPSDPTPLEELDLDVQSFADGSDPEEVAIRRADSRRVRRVLDSLPPVHRAAIILRDFEGFSYAEVAHALDISECQTKALIHRARQGFKRNWVQGLASALVPTALLQRLRGIETATRDASPSVMSIGHQVALNCSNALQQCGVFVAERAALVATAAVVSTGAIAGGVAVHRDFDQPDRRAVTIETSGEPVGQVLEGEREARYRSKASSKAAPGSEKRDEESSFVSPAPPTPKPTPTSSPAPAAAPSPQPTATPPAPSPNDRDGGGTTPAQSVEPSGFTFGSTWGGAAPEEVCGGCLRDTGSLSSNQHITRNGTFVFDHKATGNVSISGDQHFGLELEHSADATRHNSFRGFLFTDEGGYVLNGSGTFVSEAATAWGGKVYTYAGSYTLGSRPSYKEGVPTSGSYSLTVSYSSQSDRLVAVEMTLSESS